MNTFEMWPLLSGASTTFALTALGIIGGSILGLLVGIARWQSNPLLERILSGYVSIVRATPLLTLILLLFFVLPVWGLDMPPTITAVLAMTINASAFNSEIWRSGLLQFPRDQMDAARAAGMHRALLLRRIVLPQVARISLPALINEMTIMVKISPAIAVIGIVDLTRSAVRIGAETYRPLPPLLVALGLYIMLILSLILLQRWLVSRFGENNV